MPLPVQLEAVVDEMETGTDEWRPFINRKTGELVSLSGEDLRAAEIDDPPDDGWEAEEAQTAKRVLDDDDFVQLPSQYEIHEYEIMRRFCRLRDDEEERDELLASVAGRGAFRMFKSTIRRRGIEQDWYRFRDRALRRIAAEFLEAEGIPYVDDAAGAEGS